MHVLLIVRMHVLLIVRMHVLLIVIVGMLMRMCIVVAVLAVMCVRMFMRVLPGMGMLMRMLVRFALIGRLRRHLADNLRVLALDQPTRHVESVKAGKTVKQVALETLARVFFELARLSIADRGLQILKRSGAQPLRHGVVGLQWFERLQFLERDLIGLPGAGECRVGMIRWQFDRDLPLLAKAEADDPLVQGRRRSLLGADLEGEFLAVARHRQWHTFRGCDLHRRDIAGLGWPRLGHRPNLAQQLGDALDRAVDLPLIELGNQTLELDVGVVGSGDLRQDLDRHRVFEITFGSAVDDLNLRLEGRAQPPLLHQCRRAVVDRLLDDLCLQSQAVLLAQHRDRNLAGSEALDGRTARQFVQSFGEFRFEVGSRNRYLEFVEQTLCSRFGNLHR